MADGGKSRKEVPDNPLPVIRAQVMSEEPDGIFLMLAPATPPRTPAPLESDPIEQGMLDAHDLENVAKVRAEVLVHKEDTPSSDESEIDEEEIAATLEAQKIARETETTPPEIPNDESVQSVQDGELRGRMADADYLGRNQWGKNVDANFKGSYLTDDMYAKHEDNVERDQWGRPIVNTAGGMAKKVGGKWQVDMGHLQARSRDVENFRKKEDEAAAAEANNYLNPEENKFPIEDIKAGPIDGVDPGNKEKYLDDDDFEYAFDMLREEFDALPKWKQTNEKKRVGLY